MTLKNNSKIFFNHFFSRFLMVILVINITLRHTQHFWNSAMSLNGKKIGVNVIGREVEFLSQWRCVCTKRSSLSPIILHCSQCITVSATWEGHGRSHDDEKINISCKSSDASARAFSDYCALFFLGLPPWSFYSQENLYGEERSFVTNRGWQRESPGNGRRCGGIISFSHGVQSTRRRATASRRSWKWAPL